MKKYHSNLSVCFLSLLVILGFCNSSAAQDFEGIIHYEIPEMAKQGIEELPYMAKG